MIAIIDYGMGNVGSIATMVRKIGGDPVVTADPNVIERANKFVLPGVGAFDSGMANLTATGLIPLLSQRVFEEKIPILGVCLGLQLLSERSEEGGLPGLGWLEASTVRFRFEQGAVCPRIPHMGWNTIDICRSHPIFNDMPAEPRFYFVHSFHLVCTDDHTVLAKTQHGYDFASIVADGNVIGTQFHPEKSHKFGMQLMKNFVELL